MGLIVYGGDSPTVKLKEVKIRKDNDFKLMFLVERNGNPEDMEQASIVGLKLISPKAVETLLTPALIKENVIYLDIESTFNTDLGKYRLEMKYTVLDPEFTGGVRDCAVDTYAYTIVSTSSEATIIDELAKSVDVATGFQGKAFTFSMYTAEQIAELQRPALEAAQSANIAKQAAINAANEAIAAKDLTVVATTNANEATMHANASATLAQSKASEAAHAAQQAVSTTVSVLSARDQILANEGQRNANENNRKTNESSRVAAESLRVDSESERQFKELLRIEKEDIRKAAETGRSSNEALRATAETDRVSAENERKASELTRKSSESERSDNEGLRVEAEIGREQQEQLRQTNTSTAIQNANEATQSANNAAELANTKAGEANTAAQNADNARLAIQGDLGAKAFHGYESNPKTLKEVDDAKLDKSSVKQVLGASTTDVMSQKAVTDELAKKHQVVVDYTHTGNKEVNIESIDFATGTITATGHGLATNNDIFVTNNQDNTLTFPYAAIPNGLEYGKRYYAVNMTTNTFQLSITNGGSPIVISDKATKDYTKWHLEGYGAASITNLSLRKFIVEFSGRSNGTSSITDYLYLYGGKNYGGAGDVWIADTERTKIVSGLGRSLFKSMANGDIWSYNRLEIDVTGKRATILVNGYRIYSVDDTTRQIIRHINEVAVHSTVGDDTITSFQQISICNGMNIKVTKIL